MTEKAITQLRAQCPCAGIEYCPLEPLMHLPERMLIQHKCVEAFKWERSQIVGTDIGWRQAYALWAEEGFAARFAELYHDGISAEEIMKAIGKESSQQSEVSSQNQNSEIENRKLPALSGSAKGGKIENA